MRKRSTTLNRTIAKHDNEVGTLNIPTVPLIHQWQRFDYLDTANGIIKHDTIFPISPASSKSFVSVSSSLPRSPLSDQKMNHLFSPTRQASTNSMADELSRLHSDQSACCNFMDDMESTSYWSDDSEDAKTSIVNESPRAKEGSRWTLRSKKSIAEMKRKEVKEAAATTAILSIVAPISLPHSPTIDAPVTPIHTRKGIINSSRKYPPSSSHNRIEKLHRSSAPVSYNR